jgi:hypothetical protein
MGPTFDPAVVEVLEAFGRRFGPGPVQAAPADEVLQGLTSLMHDRVRARQILTQLASVGLLEAVEPGDEETLGMYGLTQLGWARSEERNREEED